MTAEKIQSKTYMAKAILYLNMRIILPDDGLQNDSEKPFAEVCNLRVRNS